MLRILLLLLALSLGTPALAGTININTASRVELDQALEGVGPSLADRIVRWREIHGPFESPEDIQNVPYVGVKTFQRNRSKIRVDDS